MFYSKKKLQKMYILFLLIKNVSPSKGVVCFILTKSSFLPKKNVHFIKKNAILYLFLKNVLSSKRVLRFILKKIYKKIYILFLFLKNVSPSNRVLCFILMKFSFLPKKCALYLKKYNFLFVS